MAEQDLAPDVVEQAVIAHSAVLVDVREPMEFASERIHGAINIPLSTFDPEFVPKLEGQKLIFQCGTGKRSRMALDRFLTDRSDEAAHLAGGLQAWKQANKPVVKIDPGSGKILDPGRA